MKRFESDNLTGKNHEGVNRNTPLHFLTASSIIGDRVHNPKGDNLGKIEDIMIDLKNGKIEYVVIEMGGFLGIGEKFFAIPFGLLKVDAKAKAFVLDQDKERMKNAPGFDKHHWPETNEHLFESTSYWGEFMGPNTGATPY